MHVHKAPSHSFPPLRYQIVIFLQSLLSHKALQQQQQQLLLSSAHQTIEMILYQHDQPMQPPHFLLLSFFHALLISFSQLPPAYSSSATDISCRSYCGNITVDYPFGLRPGCGHSGFRDLLYCINGMLMLHIPSGSYRVLDIDYAYRGLTLHEPAMSDCYSILRSPAGRGNGFVVEPWRAPYLEPDPDNVFLLLGCSAESPLFEGFPGKHLPCRNVSGMGCEEYYRCPAWGREELPWPSPASAAYGSASAPECCAVEFGAIRAINLSHLRCEGYSSAYSLAPVRPRGPGAWSYGIRASYSLPADHQGFCGACKATGGVCGYEEATGADLCLCGGGGGAYNSTSNCDSVSSQGGRGSGASSSLFLLVMVVALLLTPSSFLRA